MKIRIGNDIRLDVTLINSKHDDNVNIKSIKAYIINTTIENRRVEEAKNKMRFISRFPVEPYVDAYSSTAHDIKSAGYPTWHAFPQNYVYGSYAGFGVHPHWDDKYRPMPKHNFSEFCAPVKATEDTNVVQVSFPAEAQLYTGDYKIVIVAKIYEPGYSPNNLRTVTMDYENVFTLVNTSDEGIDSEVTLNVASSHNNSKSATSLEIRGDEICGLHGDGYLEAIILPRNIYDNSVRWWVDPEDMEYVIIPSTTSTGCRYRVINLPEGLDEYIVTIHAESVATPGVQDQITITIVRDPYYADGDNFVQNVTLEDHNVKFDMSCGDEVNLDISKETKWHVE